jgi:hypothetical protein
VLTEKRSMDEEIGMDELCANWNEDKVFLEE